MGSQALFPLVRERIDRSFFFVVSQVLANSRYLASQRIGIPNSE